MNNQSPVTFKFGSDNTYKSLQNKDENAIYFITDADGNSRIYVGDTCYNVTVVEDLDTGVIGDAVVPSTRAVVEQLNKKVNVCTLVSNDSTTLPATLLLNNNTEYRYLNLASATATSITVSIPTIATPFLYYSSVVLHEINSSDDITTFVTVAQDSEPIMFLNPSVNLAGFNTLELLFFSNGLGVCCIAAPTNYVNT